MSTNAIVLDGNAPAPLGARTRSLLRRALTLGLGAGLVLVLAGDRGARTAVPTGIDPLEVLNLQVRANAIVMLDTSGSMRERPDCVDSNNNGNCDTTQEGELAGDDESAKLYLAKQVLKTVVQQNQTKVSFQFGRYQQVTTSYGPQTGNFRFIYTCLTTVPTGSTEQTCTAAQADWTMNLNLPSSGGTLARTAGTDTRTDSNSIKTFLLGGSNYHVNQQYKVQDPSLGSTVTFCSVGTLSGTAWSPPTPSTDWNVVGKDQPYIEIAHFTTAGCSGSPSYIVRYYFRGVRWNKGNDGGGTTPPGSCSGFASQVPLASCTNDDQISSIGPFLQPEVVATTADNDTMANLRLSTANGFVASGLTPLARSLSDFRTIFGSTTTTGLWGVGASPNPPIATMSPKPSTFAIIVTDGDDTCAGGSADQNALTAASNAAALYGGIPNSGGAGIIDPKSRVKTFVVVIGSTADSTRANWIAWGGSGMVPAGGWSSAPTATDRANCTTCVDAFLASDAQALADALQSAIDQGQSAGEFSDQQSITESVFEFAAVSGVTLPSPSPGVSPLPSPDPLNPTSRYQVTIPVLLQSTFELPQFNGHLNAFKNNQAASSPSPAPSGAPAPAWASTLNASDAGQKLENRITTSLPSPGPYSFSQLRGGPTVLTDANIRTGGTGTIKRRIYTTPRNGVFINTSYPGGGTRSGAQIVQDLQDNDPTTNAGAATFRVAIWPPTTGTTGSPVDPTGSSGSYPAGLLDNALGIGANPLPTPTGGAAPAAFTFAQLQTLFGACTAAPSTTTPTTVTNGRLPQDCASTTPSIQLAAARKEARQIILAWIAGADLVTANKKAVRKVVGTSCDVGTGTTPVTTTTVVGDIGTLTGSCGSLQFKPRQWVLGESTLAAPGVVTPPLEIAPPGTQHGAEFALYRDGPRTSGPSPAPQNPDTTGSTILMGLGLRNPDKDGPTTPNTSRMRLKPVMSVVYHATNSGLHAFRAGPCRDSSGGNACQNGDTETGGEELWAFIPFDQLQNIKERMKPQTRDPHAYMLASPVRFADVFVPVGGTGTWSRTIGSVTMSGAGVWRTVLLFGRGIAGKYYTALDITAPGPFTEGSLSTKGPIPLWSRGNPDTQDMTASGTANNGTSGNTDAAAYGTMGQTWSVPAIANVAAGSNTTARVPTGVEFVAYTGSGFGAAGEGSTFYTLDVLTGDVVASVDVGDRASAAYDNAIVAGPSAFNAAQLTPPNIAKIAVTPTTRVYFGDNNGRVWRVMTDTPSSALLFGDLGANQPIGNSLALLNYKGSGTTERPHVFVEAGNDNRITPPPASTPPFKMYGLRDDDLATDPNAGDGVDGPAVVLFTQSFPDGFRGNVQPATAFNDQTPPLGRVFFVGNRFNPITASSTSCTSSFDAILFALGAESGNAAYDLNATGSDLSITKTGQRVQSVRVSGGRLVLDTGLQADIAPPPPAPPAPVAAPPGNADVFFGPQPTAVNLIAQSPVVYKLGSSVCR